MESPHARVLLLDDDTRAVERAVPLLEQAGYAVRLSGRRHRRVELIAELRPDLVLLGVRVPYVVGDEVLEACTRHPALRTIPVLIFSACDQAYLEDMLKESGAAGFVRKVRLREELVATVRLALARRPLARGLPISAA